MYYLSNVCNLSYSLVMIELVEAQILKDKKIDELRKSNYKVCVDENVRMLEFSVDLKKLYES